MSANSLKPPGAGAGDAAHTAAKAVLSSVPYVGGPLVELFQFLVMPPLDRRRHEWMTAVGARLEALEKKGVPIRALQENEEFVSAVMHASHIAVRTHNREKREALANAIENVAMGQAPEEALQHVFLGLVDAFTELHLRVLKLFQAPIAPPGILAGGLNHVLEHSIPALAGKQDMYRMIWRDLYLAGLLNTENINVMMTGRGLVEKRTTPIGDQFLSFISHA